MRNHASILKRGAYLGSYVGGVPHVPKILLVGQLDEGDTSFFLLLSFKRSMNK